MDKTRLLELAGLITEKKWSADVKPKWSPPEGFFTKSAAEIVKGLLAAGEKKAMSRLNFYMNRAGKKLSDKDKARLDKAKEMLSNKLEAMKEELEGVMRRAGILTEKKHVDMDMDGESDPEMDMDDSEDKPSKDSDEDDMPKKKKKEGDEEEEDPLPAIVHKIAKKAVGKDEEELETLIMKVYDAGHKDGLKDAEEDGDKPKKKKKDEGDAPKSDMPDMYTHHKTMKVKNKMDESTLLEKHHVKKKGKVVKVGTKKDCMDYCDKNDGCSLHKGEPMSEDIEDLMKKYGIEEDTLTEKHHVKKKGKVMMKGSKKECMDYCDKNDGCTLHKGEPDRMDEMFVTEKHHVKKKGKVVKVGSKKACMDYCDDNDGCTLHKGEPDMK